MKPTMYERKLHRKSMGRIMNGMKYMESIMTPERVNGLNDGLHSGELSFFHGGLRFSL